MAKQSSQKFIGRNRAPRVQIEYDVELYGAQAALVKLGEYHGLFTGRVESHQSVQVEGLEAILRKVYGPKKKTDS